MILIRSLRLEVGEELSALQGKAAKALGCKAGEIRELKLVKRSLDARKKNDIHYVCAVCRVTSRAALALSPSRRE